MRLPVAGRAYLIIFASSVIVSTPSSAQEFEGLGFPPGGSYSFPSGISADGTVVVGESDTLPGGNPEAVLWTQSGGAVGLGVLTGGTFSYATGTNADGSVVVGAGDSSSASGIEAFRWTQAGGMIGLGFLSGHGQSYAFGVSSDGSVVVGGSGDASTGAEAFRWTQANGMVGLGVLAGYDGSIAWGVSGDGSVVVGANSLGPGLGNDLYQAFRWTQGSGMQALGFLAGGNSSDARAVSSDGSTIVGYGNRTVGSDAYEAFRWTQADGMLGLGVLSGDVGSQAWAVSGDGAVVVGQSYSLTGGQAFRWTQSSGMESVQALLVGAGVDLTGWHLDSATGVSTDGTTIVGYGTNPGSATEVWIARIVDDVGGVTTPEAQQQSANTLANNRFGLLVQQHGFAVPLLGGDKPISNTNEVGVFASAGSVSAGGFVRYATGGGVSLLAGVAYAQEDYPDAELRHAGMGAVALQYIAPTTSWWRPFAESGGWLAPGAELSFDRTYLNGAGTATGVGRTKGDLTYVYARAGVIFAPAAYDQVVISGEIGRQWLDADGYSETFSQGNPFPAVVGAGTDRSDIAKLRLAWSHRFSHQWDATLWAAGVQAFNREADFETLVLGVGTFQPSSLNDSTWVEYGVRVGYGLSETVTVDAFVNGVSGEDEIGTRAHAGLGLRVQY